MEWPVGSLKKILKEKTAVSESRSTPGMPTLPMTESSRSDAKPPKTRLPGT